MIKRLSTILQAMLLQKVQVRNSLMWSFICSKIPKLLEKQNATSSPPREFQSNSYKIIKIKLIYLFELQCFIS